MQPIAAFTSLRMEAQVSLLPTCPVKCVEVLTVDVRRRAPLDPRASSG
jgi:hypothetical protein